MFKNKIIKQFFTYSFGALLLRGISVMLAPIYMRTLSPHDYGILSLAYSFVCIATAIIGCGLRHVLTFDYFHHTPDEQKAIVNEVLIIYTFIGGCFFACGLLLRSVFIQYIFMNELSTLLMTAILCTTFFTFFSELFEQVMQYRGYALQLTLTQIANALVRISVILTLLLVFEMSYASMIWGQLVGVMFMVTAGGYWYIADAYRPHALVRESVAKTKEYVKRGAPLIPKVLLMWVLSGGDRWVLARYGTLHDVGIYSVADAFSYLFYLVILMPWQGSYLPWILRTFTENKNDIATIERKNHRIMWATMLAISALMVTCYVVFQPLLRIIIPTNYHEALNYILIILSGQVFLLGANFASCIIQFRKQSYLLLIALFIPATLNIALNILLVPHYRLYGCTGATLTSYIVYFGLTLFLGYRAAHKTPKQSENAHN